jgi:hypothetical protein
MKYLAPQVQIETGPSKKQMFDEYVSRMKLTSGGEPVEQNVETEHCHRCNVAREEVAAEGILVCPVF